MSILVIPSCDISSETVVTIPGGTPSKQRDKLGVREFVALSTTALTTWSISSGEGCLISGEDYSNIISLPRELAFREFAGKCHEPSSSIQDTIVYMLAPFSAGTTVVSAENANVKSCSRSFFTTVEPSNLIFQLLESPPLQSPGYAFYNPVPPFYQIGMYSIVFLAPGDVSFANVSLSEKDSATPSYISQYSPSLLTSVGGANAWFFDCDYDKDQGYSEKTSFWTFVDPISQKETRFSEVLTETTHIPFSKYRYSKGQIAALSAGGGWVGARTPAAVLKVPSNSPYVSLQPLDRESCASLVQKQYNFIP